MPETAKHDDIEDVLSSIRRLVADASPPGVEAEPEPDAVERLVLTPSLRVAEVEEVLSPLSDEMAADDAVVDPLGSPEISDPSPDMAEDPDQVAQGDADEAVDQAEISADADSAVSEDAAPEYEMDHIAASNDAAQPDEASDEIEQNEASDHDEVDEPSDHIEIHDPSDEAEAEDALDEAQAEEELDAAQAEEELGDAQAEEALDEAKAEEALDEAKAEEALDEAQAEEELDAAQADEVSEAQADAVFDEAQAAAASDEALMPETADAAETQEDFTTEGAGEVEADDAQATHDRPYFTSVTFKDADDRTDELTDEVVAEDAAMLDAQADELDDLNDQQTDESQPEAQDGEELPAEASGDAEPELGETEAEASAYFAGHDAEENDQPIDATDDGMDAPVSQVVEAFMGTPDADHFGLTAILGGISGEAIASVEEPSADADEPLSDAAMPPFANRDGSDDVPAFESETGDEEWSDIDSVRPAIEMAEARQARSDEAASPAEDEPADTPQADDNSAEAAAIALTSTAVFSRALRRDAMIDPINPQEPVAPVFVPAAQTDLATDAAAPDTPEALAEHSEIDAPSDADQPDGAGAAPDTGADTAPLGDIGDGTHPPEQAGGRPGLADEDYEPEQEAAEALASLDEVALRELVAQVVREELQGALGQRITRNVRKMVRREIRLALVAEDYE